LASLFCAKTGRTTSNMSVSESSLLMLFRQSAPLRVETDPSSWLPDIEGSVEI
jgi:hypothetical protein